jgi:hypothetical protein
MKSSIGLIGAFSGLAAGLTALIVTEWIVGISLLAGSIYAWLYYKAEEELELLKVQHVSM